jgi:tRNA-2-methylthio-N6-dimethylallyladenosine synthase
MLKTYHIITIGCQMNKSDSERMAAWLESQGFLYEEKRKQAQVVIITTCGVRQSAEDRIYGLIPRIRKENPQVKIILTGCLSERDDVKKRVKGQVDVFLPIRALPELENYINSLYSKEAIEVSADKSPGEEKYLSIKPKYSSNISAFVPIGNGCNNFCSYCVVPYARHKEVYRKADDIISEVKELVKKNYKEITLIAQNVNSFKDKDKDFADLLKIVNDIPGDFWLRFATSHPKDMSDKLIELMPKLDKLTEYVHLPAQAGNNQILKAMNRNYTAEHYLSLLKKIRESYSKNNNKLPVCITTDIIVGFPGETREQFEDTVELFNKAGYDMAYIARYSPRPGTVAEKMQDNVSPKEKKRREYVLMGVLRETALANNQYYLNKIVEVLVEGRNKKGEWFGKTRTFKNVKTTVNSKQTTENYKGKVVKVKIDKVENFGLSGALL